MQKYTIKLIKEEFMDIVSNKPYDKITVSELISKCKINRNTFYYYFENMDTLLKEVFEDILQQIEKETKAEDSFYDAYIITANITLKYKKIILNVYKTRGSEYLRAFFENIAHIYIGRLVIKRTSTHNISEQGINYITNFYTYTLVGYTFQWIQNGIKGYPIKTIKKLSETVEATIEAMITDWDLNGFE